MVNPEFRGMKLSRRIYDVRKQICREKNLERMIIGGRIPGYHKYADKMSAREYVEQVMAKATFDPVLTAQVANSFALKGLIPNYVPDDEQSPGYATHLEWLNFDYKHGAKRRFRRAGRSRCGWLSSSTSCGRSRTSTALPTMHFFHRRRVDRLPR